MNHDHLPALKRYTSQVQYDALKSIDDTKSIKELVFSGSSNRTLGVLVRSAWINTFTYVKDEVKHEGWCITDAGKHAMTLFEAQLKIEAVKKEKAQEYVNKYAKLLIAEYEVELKNQPEIERLDMERQKLASELAEVRRERSRAEYGMNGYDKHRGIDIACKHYADKGIKVRVRL
jgi:hypothetical protein